MGDSPRRSQGPHGVTRVHLRGKREGQNRRRGGDNGSGGRNDVKSQDQECEQPLETGKGQEQIFP